MALGIDDDSANIITPYDTNGETPKARLLVEEGDSWVRVPILDDGVTTHVRKGGPLDINRVTDVYVPREWQGTDFAQYIDAFDASKQNVYDKAEVQLYDSVEETYVTVHNGFVEAFGGSGSSEDTDAEPADTKWRLRLLDPAVFLNVIEASETFREASVTDVLEYIRDEFVAAQPLWDDVPIITRGEVSPSAGEGTYVPSIPFTIDVRETLSTVSDIIRSPKTFTSNRDTLADVVAWLANGSTASVYFTTLSDGKLALLYDATPTAPSFEATNLDGNVTVRNNNALFEISPRNALQYKGRSKSSLVSLGEFELTMPSDKYPSIDVYHEPSVERAGGETFYGRTVEGDAINLDDAEAAAKRQLKKALDGASGGKIECAITPFVRPYGTLDATPACDGNLDSDVQPYTYEIEEVTHKVTARNGARTDLRVSPHVAMDDIVVETAAMKEK